MYILSLCFILHLRLILQNTHNTMDLRAFKDANITRHDSLMPGFAKTNMNTRPVSRIKG